MGRRPIGSVAMTDAERQRRRRNRARHGDRHVMQDVSREPGEPHTEFWQRSLANAAGDALALRAHWTRLFGDWQRFQVPTSLVTLAEQAAQEWTQLARDLATQAEPPR